MVQARYLWIVIILFIQYTLPAQSSENDSLSAIKIDSLTKLSGDNWNRNGPFDRNIKWLTEAEQISSQSGNWERQVECLLKLSTVYSYKKDSYHFNKVVLKSKQVADLHLEKDHFYYLYIYNNLSDLYRKNRSYRKSTESSEKGIKMCKGCNTYSLSYYYIRIANNYISLGDYAKAKKYLNNAVTLEYKDTENDSFQKYHSHFIYAILGIETEDHLLAIEHLELAEKYLMEYFREDYMNELVNIWFEFIDNYMALGKYPEVEKYLKKVKNSKFLDDTHTRGKYKIRLAEFNYYKNNHITDKILDLIDEGNNLLTQVESSDLSLDDRISLNLEFKGDIYFEHGDHENALLSFNKALDKIGYSKYADDASKVNEKAIVLRLLYKKIEILLLQNNFEEANKIEIAMLYLIRYLRIENSSSSTIDFWANENLKVIEQIIKYNHQKGNYSKVYALIEENKSNLLIQDLTENESLGYANIKQEKIEEGARLNSELAYCRKNIFEIRQSGNMDSSSLSKWINEESRLQIDLDSYLRNLETDYPEYYELKYELKEFGVKNAQIQLDQQSVLIEYFIGSKKGYLAYVTNDNLEIIEIKNPALIQELTLDYYSSLRDKSDEFEKISKRLHEALALDKLKEINPDAKHLIVIADDFLNNIPFETLIDGSGDFLLDQYDIQYQYSARLWEMMKSRKSEEKRYDLVSYAFDNDRKLFAENRSCFDLENATNLKCAEKEIRSAMEILESKNILNVEQNMQELFESTDKTKILHLATHACLDETESDYSRIYFNDTLLTSQDLKLRDFSADLVVLSACETGFGEVIKGEGSMSLSKDFFHAGAKSTLVSLWPVDDCATADLMGYFYENIKKGLPKDEALKNAKNSYRQYANPEKTHPYYWAGFIVVGDCSPIWNNDYSLLYMLSLPIAIIVLLVLLKMYKSRKILG